jgi:heme/copper-type cytochrome/quinol oxidase subunit 2
MSEPLPSNNDPSPEERKGDSSFLPVVVMFVIVIIVILIGAIVFIKARQSKAVPNPKEPHPTSQTIPSPLRPSQPQISIAA